MKGKKVLKWLIVPLLALMIVVWYRIPVKALGGIRTDRVAKIEIFDGNTGYEVDVTSPEQIRSITDNLSSVKVKRDGVSLFRMGYRFRMVFLDANGQELGKLILNAPDTVRKDPFFYRTTGDDTLCYDEIWNIFDGSHGYIH